MGSKLFTLILILILTSGCVGYVSLSGDVVRQNVTVDHVMDGDTFVLTTGQKVRLIGMDAPELGRHYSYEAKAKLEEFVLNKTVTLEKDVSEKDKYGRLLRYVYIGDVFVNLELVRLGYAEEFSYFPDVKYENEFKLAEEEANATKIGMWASSKG